MPLLLTHDGKKFGKSENGTIWLDKNKTSVFDFYKFWLNVSDNDVIKLLKQFTFLTIEEINDFSKSLIEEPHLRLAHKALANEMTLFVHGKNELNIVLKLNEVLFNDNIHELNENELHDIFNCKGFNICNDFNLTNLLVNIGICNSNNKSRNLIKSNSISINDVKITNVNYVITEKDFLFNEYMIIKKGKKTFEFLKLK